MNNQTIQSLVSTFAKENKISKVKLQSFTDSILAMQPKNGRPMLDKTKQIQDNILGYIKQGKTCTNDIIKASGIDKVLLNNNIKALEKKGVILRCGKVHTGKRGRQPVVYQVNM